MNVGTAPVLIQCYTDAWQYTNVGCLPALDGGTAPVFSQCRPSGVPTLGTVLIGSTGITHGLQPERYRAGCKDWQYTDFSAWVTYKNIIFLYCIYVTILSISLSLATRVSAWNAVATESRVPRRKSLTYAGSYERHSTAPVVNEEHYQYWSLVPRRALADLGIYAERWCGTGLVLPQYRYWLINLSHNN